jgi:hypothetical protein
MGKSTISMAIFNSYVKLPEGTHSTPSHCSSQTSHPANPRRPVPTLRRPPSPAWRQLRPRRFGASTRPVSRSSPAKRREFKGKNASKNREWTSKNEWLNMIKPDPTSKNRNCHHQERGLKKASNTSLKKNALYISQMMDLPMGIWKSKWMVRKIYPILVRRSPRDPRIRKNQPLFQIF